MVGGLLGEKFSMEKMVPQITKESTKIPEGIPVSLPVSIQLKQENKKDRGISNSSVKLNNTVIHQCKIPGQH